MVTADGKFPPAIITAVTPLACLTSHGTAPPAGRKSHSASGTATINMRLIEFTTLASGAAAWAAGLF